ncbi:hypothetical protein N7486_003530 [Penicillium sp. IBT 16267x]|nr:hypothetical protein N7486_003530 [Penicillium sp. IBT 16267x]
MHSTTECTVGTGIIISMENMARVLSVDQERLTITVQGGFSSFVLGVKLGTPTGENMEISESQNAKYLPAIRSHFGMLGVVCEVSQIDTFIDNFAEELKALKGANDQVFEMLFPTTGKLLWQCRKFLDPAILRPDSPTAWLNPIESRNISLFGGLFLPLVKAVTALRLSAAKAGPINNAMVDLPLKIIRHSRYIVDPCDRGVIYAQGDPNFEFYDWVFPEEKWCDMVRAFLQLSDRFRQQHDFILPLPALVYFIKKD